MTALLLVACEPAIQSPALVDLCARKYVAATDGVSLSVGMSNELGADYRFYAVCLQVDGAGVMYAHEPGEQRIVVSPGAHTITAYAKWAAASNAELRFEVKSSHQITTQTSNVVHVTFVEIGNGPLQDRPKARWSDGT